MFLYYCISLPKMVRFQPDGFSLRPREVQDMATSAYVVSDMNSKVFPCAVLQVWSSKPAGNPRGPGPGARGPIPTPTLCQFTGRRICKWAGPLDRASSRIL